MNYTVYIADDNKLFKESILNTMPWKEYNCEIIGDADNGDTALKDILAIEPDIILLDICMPGFSGIEIVRKIKENKLKSKIIMITGYSDFNYIKECMRLDVNDYILKPLEEKELLDVIKKVQEEINSTRIEQREIIDLRQNKEELLKNQQESSLKYMKKLLLDSISGYEKSSIELENLIHENYGSFSGYYVFQILRTDENYNLNNFFENTKLALQQNIEKQRDLIYTIKDKTITALVLFHGVMLTKEFDMKSIAFANNVYSSISKPNENIVICIGGFHKKISELAVAFREVEFAYNTRFFIENKNIIHYSSIKSKSIVNEYALISKMDDFYDILKNEPELSYTSLTEIYEQILSDDYYDIDYVKTIFTHICLMVNSLILSNYANSPEIKSICEITKDMSELKSIKETYEYSKRYIQKYEEIKNFEEKVAYTANVCHILDYLNTHYMEKITLQDVSDATNISTIHICRLLKKEMGETFVNILNKIRIKHAIRLLKEGNMKVYEIAELTGFSNYAYFYQLFKKETGISPTDYCNSKEQA